MPASKRKHADVAVVGGGCMGASIAWHLARRGEDVVLFERRYVGAESTGHSGALIRRHYEHPIGLDLADESLRFFERFASLTGRNPGYVRVGFTTGARAKDVPALEKLLALQREHGVVARLVTTDELRALEPEIDAADLAAGVYDERSGYADPVATAQGFAAAAADEGAEVHEGVEARRVLVEGGRVTGVRGKRSTVRAERVVVAAGNRTPYLLDPIPVRLPIRFVRGDVAILRRPPDMAAPRLHFDYYHDTYSRPDGARDTLVGYMGTGTRTSRARPTPFDATLRERTARDLQRRLTARFPAFARAQRRGGYGGLYDMTPDHYPILGPAGPTGLYVAAGFSGHGFKLCPAVGRLLAEAVSEGRIDPILEALAPDRFRKRRPIRPAAPFGARGRRVP